MSRFLQTHPCCIQRWFSFLRVSLLAVTSLAAGAGCGGVACPDQLVDVGGACREVGPFVNPDPEVEPRVERCDGVDNDGDTEVDEEWPLLGEACGDVVGECAAGTYVCAADGADIICDGAVGPSAEVCDGKDNDCDGTPDNGPDETCDGEDNDCDGLIDEGVLSIKEGVFDDHATVASIDGGFVVTRAVGDRLRMETYDMEGEPTGHRDEIFSPDESTQFLESDGAGQRVLVALGQQSFHVIEADINSQLVPEISGSQRVHEGWDPGHAWSISFPPYNPRVLASPPRFLGLRHLREFALSTFGATDLSALTEAPTAVPGVPFAKVFDAAGLYIVWEQADNLRTALLANDGAFALEIDVARGTSPGIAIGEGGPGVVYLQDGRVRLSELGGATLQCRSGAFCNEAIDMPVTSQAPSGPTGLAFNQATDAWFVAAGTQVAVVGRGENRAVVTQGHVVDSLGDSPNRIDVVVSGGTAAVLQASEEGETALTFLGCF